MCTNYRTDKGYIGAYPMKTKGEATKSIPTGVICDPAREQSTNELKQCLSTVGATLRLLEQGTQWANRAELVIGQLKAAVRSTMRKCYCPLVLWDYCLEWYARINNMTAKNLFQLKSQTPFFTVHGREGDISNLAMFSTLRTIQRPSLDVMTSLGDILVQQKTLEVK